MLVIEGKKEEQQEISLQDAVNRAKKLVDSGMRISRAAKETAAETPFKKADIYRELL